MKLIITISAAKAINSRPPNLWVLFQTASECSVQGKRIPNESAAHFLRGKQKERIFVYPVANRRFCYGARLPKRGPAALLAPLESLHCKLSNGARSEQNPAKKFFFLLPARIATQSVAGGEEKIGARKLKNVKKTFLRGGEVSERRRGWLPYWGFCSKKVRTSIKKYRQ